MSGNEKNGRDAWGSGEAETETRAGRPAGGDAAEAGQSAGDTGPEGLDAEAVDLDAAVEDDTDPEADDSGPSLDEDVMPDEEADLLIPVEDYLGAGVHIGTQQKTQDMGRFIHRVRTDGLYVLDVSMTDERIRTAANFLAGYDPEQILVASSRQYARFPAETVAHARGTRARARRVTPGTSRNPA